MVDQQELRASDRDRQQVVERLRGALDDGRLTMAEYVDRMGVAYQAATYGDLAPLYADLPAPAPAPAPAPVPAPAPGPAPAGPGTAAAPPAVTSRAGGLAGLPLVLKLLWTVWLVAVSVNVVVWILVRDPGGHLSYPWPLWVAGPYGTVLFAVSASVILFRRTRPPVRCRCGS